MEGGLIFHMGEEGGEGWWGGGHFKVGGIHFDSVLSKNHEMSPHTPH